MNFCKTILLTAGAFAGLTAYSANLISNGEFEAFNQWSWDGQKPATLSAESPYGGKSCLLISGDTPGKSGYVYQHVKMEPGKSYKLTLFVKSENAANNDFSVRCLLWKKDPVTGKNAPCGWLDVPAKSGVIELVNTGGTHDWKEFTKVIPGDAIPQVDSMLLFLNRKDNGTGKVYIDDLVLEEIPQE